MRKGTKKNPITGKYEVPNEVASNPVDNPPTAETTEVRPQIADMLASGSEKDFEKSLSDPPAKRTRRTRSEIDAANAPADPLMSDPIFKAQIERMSTFGMDTLINIPCEATGKPLTGDESADVRGTAYVITKAKISKGQGVEFFYSWPFLIIYSLALLARLIFSRTDLGDKMQEMITQLFNPPKPIEQPKEQLQ
jgi:hypothetical protein